MADELGAELSLDLDAARREVESFRRDLEDELERAVTSFADEYERAVGNLPTIEPEIDAAVVTDELTRAVQATDGAVPIEVDGGTITSSINEAVGATAAVADIDVDTGLLTSEILEAVEGVHPTITPEVDTTVAQSQLDELGETVGGTAQGLGAADLEAQALEDTLGDLGAESEQTSDRLGSVSNVSTTTATAFSAAKGDGRDLIKQLAAMSPALKGVAAGGLAVSAGFIAMFQAGQANLQSIERSNLVLGDFADRIETINVGGLSGDLGELATRAGSSDGALRSAATSAAQVGLSSGKSAVEVTDFANKVNALALRAVAMNPALGDAGAVAERLNSTLARGGRFLTRYGLDLTASEITLRALADTGKTAVADLTLFERSVAGADIAVEKLGANLGADFEKGAATATLRLRALKTEMGNAFAEAGEPLVEPTLKGLESLAEASSDVSKILGSLAETVMPVVATGLESVGQAASIVTDAFGAIPAEVLAIGAALFALDRATKGQIRSFETLRIAGSVAMDSPIFRGTVALGGLVALDQGLQAAGTSTKELGIEMAATGAAIGFAAAGPIGAFGGAIVGAVAQAISSEDNLARKTREVEEEFARAEAGSGDLRAALFANAETADDLATAMSALDSNFANFIRSASAFQALGLDDDLLDLNLTAGDLVDLLKQGDVGLAKFIGRTQEAGKVTYDLRDAITEMLKPDFNDRIAAQGAANAAIRELGVGAKITGEEYANLNEEQQKYVLAALKNDGANTKLIASYQTLQKQVRLAEKEQFEMFATTNKLSPAIVEAARNAGGADGKTRDWAKSLVVLGDAARGLLPEMGNITAETGDLQREFNALRTAAEGAAAAIPTIGAALSKGLGVGFTENLEIPNPAAEFDKNAPESISVGPVLFDEGQKIIDSLNQTEEEVRSFFEDIAVIAEAGASHTAAALLTLGPDNLGARMAADLAANKEQFRSGMEKAFEGIAEAQVFGESLIGTMKSRVEFLMGDLGGTLEQQLLLQFGKTDLSEITTPQLVAYVERFGAGGSEAAQALYDSYNREIATRKLLGLDTSGLTGAVDAAKEHLAGAGIDISNNFDATVGKIESTLYDKVPPAFQVFPLAIEDIQPEVLQGLNIIGQTVSTGAQKSKQEWDEEFRGIVGFTQGIMTEVRVKVDQETGLVTNAVTGAIIGAIDLASIPAYNAAVNVGQHIVDGIALGVHSAEWHLKQQLSATIGAAYDEVRFQEGILSPAKRWMPIGEYIIQGIGVGARSEAAAVSKDLAGIMRGFREAPVPPAGAQPIVNVTVDASGLAPNRSVTYDVGGIHNYGPDRDARGDSTMRRLREVSHLSGGW